MHESPAFLFEAFFFGVTRGEQPLVRASRASKVAGAFLVLFWQAKENSVSIQNNINRLMAYRRQELFQNILVYSLSEEVLMQGWHPRNSPLTTSSSMRS